MEEMTRTASKPAANTAGSADKSAAKVVDSASKSSAKAANDADKRTPKQKEGDWGEDKAAELLKSKGYRVVCRKFRSKIGEIDVVAVKGNVIAFVEVKTRRRLDYGMPCEAVGPAKQRRLRMTAEYFRMVNGWTKDMQPRMDIIEILCLDKGNFIRHLENAF